MASNSKYQKAQQVQLTILPPTYLDLVITDDGWESNYPHYTFFWKENFYLIT